LDVACLYLFRIAILLFVDSFSMKFYEKGSARVRMTVGEYNRYCAAKPVLTVIDGGKDDDDAARYGAWIEGERS
jgi:hypothetical protein